MIARYYHSDTLGGDICRDCEPSLIGIVPDLIEYKLRAGGRFFCLICKDVTRRL